MFVKRFLFVKQKCCYMIYATTSYFAKTMNQQQSE